jgi:hypothetical protein
LLASAVFLFSQFKSRSGRLKRPLACKYDANRGEHTWGKITGGLVASDSGLLV